MPIPTTSRRSEDGFTLIEILTGLLISSIIMVGLSLAMRAVDLGYDRATTSLERQATIASGLDIVAGDIARIERVVDDPTRPSRFLFSGQSKEIIFILAERPGNNRSGLYWVRLAVRPAGDGEELVRFRAPYSPGQHDIGAIAWGDEVVLLHGSIRIELAYRAPRSGLRSWAGGWQAAPILPGEIKVELIDIATNRLRVPVFVSALKIDAEVDCVSNAAPGCTIASNGQLGQGSGN